MLEKMKKIINSLILNKEYDKESCRGAVLLVEATIVLPIVFFVIFFIICLGNAYYVRAYMQSIADKYAIQAANYARCENLLYIEEGGDLMKMDLNPYQFSVSSKLKNTMNQRVKSAVNSKNVSLFGSMKPTRIGSGSQSDYVKFYNGIFDSYAEVEIEYNLNMMPVLGSIKIASTKVTAKAKAQINDSPSFIRNLDMVKDLATDFLQTDTGKNLVGKLKGNFTKVTSNITDALKNFMNFFKK